MTTATRPVKGLALVGVGAFLAAASATMAFYMAPNLVKTPLDGDSATVATGTATLLDTEALIQGVSKVDRDVPIRVLQQVTVEDPSDGNKITMQSAVLLQREDRPGERGTVNATVDRFTADRRSAMPLDDPIGSIQKYVDQPADEVTHDGLSLKFPFDVEQRSYPYFDTTARRSQAIDFAGETTIHDLDVYRFEQDIAPLDTGGKLTLPASYWGIEGDEEILMHRFYTARRELMVEPTTGAVVFGKQTVHQYYGRTAADPNAVTIIEMSPQLDTKTVEAQVQRAAESKRLVEWVELYGPLSVGAVGLGALTTGLVLLRRKGAEGHTSSTGEVDNSAPHTYEEANVSE
ncbi:DUF3068 domain-containing protein [Rhodococcus sp. 06-156-3C]|uniref:DUF3068 domain-containing protein n=1 Tax=Nocardiaceae TaxID=85025 RepID=UPI00068DB1EE|nr:MULTISPECIES: DUF3068 domain-containing protein [Rhodococcus]OZD18291.1 DUF3068 domain-containing protein [Rhodococcus sp. 06-156-4C]OZD18889.1 DUF3068 domain-containing protein [Rhodococcus sp. 06-156-3C]OZD22399.1 DUF3068 domain-containing protein [Rhodococcus sp. 06-156-4a]OZD33983.1 DUF3068 domain-containing protein [Rhodococcus sp. 06-156-3b]OZD38720.1 DUF3068 domain-containing protein [Rhodococcus sp. 06-156-3]